MLLNPVTFHNPKSITDANRLFHELQDVKLHAGGTFLLNQLKLLKRNGAKTPENVITLGHLKELQGVHIQNDRLLIGSMTTIADLFSDPVICEHLPVLHTVCRNISTQPIRNMATIGGNLTCRYTWTEMPAVSICLQAQLHFIDKSNAEVILDPEEFFANAAKTKNILTHISFPIVSNRRVAYRRAKKSQYVDIPMLSLMISAIRNDKALTQFRIAINNCVEFAQRDRQLEEYLNATNPKQLTPEEIQKNMSVEIYTKRGNEYKTHLFNLYIRQGIEELISDES